MKYSAFKNSLRFASKFCQKNNYKVYMNSVPQFSTFTYGKHIKTNPLTSRLDDLLKKNSNLISIMSVNGLDDLITQSSKIESVSIAEWLLNLVEEYQLMLSCVNMTTIRSWFSIRSIRLSTKFFKN
ncbi:conserved Plasmodium protein, unknown function [Plasmodium gallinaceum]|uniref:Uncharacterized protein n=1 Tax=Plasmodium gallinaceum TaxID=5849 RepID=A0A1J1GN70_PLAGA|nr:conserved Plasmodium protein, unknown function [Plasmodium gallinaceum]CRG93709.1 conserved Plasmodium protein, unknown function [Plasmodium gallinaceum]